MKRLKIALALSLGLSVSPAAAQYYDGTFWIGQTGAMNNIIGLHTLGQHIQRVSGEDEQTASTAVDSLVAKQASSVSLAYTPSMQRRRANYAGFVERSRRVDPAGADGLAETLSSDPIAMMKPELAKVGLNTENVADAYAVYWVEAWQAVHGVTGASSRSTAQAVRAQAAKAISAIPEFERATPAQKQEFAEAHLVQALLVGAAKEQAQGDRAKLSQLSAAVEKGARASGLDLRAMTLTEEGFGPVRKTGAVELKSGAESQVLAATGDAGSRPSYGFLAAAGGAGLGAALLIGKAMGRKG